MIITNLGVSGNTSNRVHEEAPEHLRMAIAKGGDVVVIHIGSHEMLSVVTRLLQILNLFVHPWFAHSCVRLIESFVALRLGPGQMILI